MQNDTDNRRSSSLLALLLTLLLTVGTVALLLLTSLHCEYTPHHDQLAQLKQDSIMFGGEFVQLGNTADLMDDDMMDNEAADDPAADDEGEEPDISADDMDDAGTPTQKTPPVVTQREESPHKVKEVEKKPDEPKKPAGPTRDNDKKVDKPRVKANDAQAVQTKTQKKTDDQQKSNNANNATNNRVKNAFGNSNGTGGARQGNADGNTNRGAVLGRPSIGGLVGYTLEHWAKPTPNSMWSGRVVVKVRVNPRGKVTSANVTSATGELASHPQVRKACEQAAMKSSFSVPKNTTTEGIGTITYIWK